MGRYRCVLFDMDGTLLDSLDDLRDSMNHVLKEHGFPERSREEIKSFLGYGSRWLVEKSLPDGLSEEEVEKYHRECVSYYGAHLGIKTKPYDGISEVMADLREKGIHVAVVSNKFQKAVQGLCKQYFPNLTDDAAGEREAEGIRKKPAPDMAFSIMEHLGHKPAECVYVGDSEVDIETAKNAGIDCLSVTWGFRTPTFLKESGASRIIDTMEELEEAILKTE